MARYKTNNETIRAEDEDFMDVVEIFMDYLKYGILLWSPNAIKRDLSYIWRYNGNGLITLVPNVKLNRHNNKVRVTQK